MISPSVPRFPGLSRDVARSSLPPTRGLRRDKLIPRWGGIKRARVHGVPEVDEENCGKRCPSARAHVGGGERGEGRRKAGIVIYTSPDRQTTHTSTVMYATDLSINNRN